jgi:hypothetical protein
MKEDGNTLGVPGFADKKSAKIIYEETYLPRERLEDIMALDFLD